MTLETPCRADVGAIYARMREPLRRFLQRHVRDPDATHDLLHDVFLRVHARRASLATVEDVEAWVFAIARNALVDHARRRDRRREVQLDPDLPAAEPHASDALHDLAQTARRCIEFVPQPYRDALVATAFDGLSQKAYAARVGLSLSGAKSRVQRARRILADLYRTCCDLEFDSRGELVDFVPRRACAPLGAGRGSGQRVKNETPASRPRRKASLSKP